MLFFEFLFHWVFIIATVPNAATAHSKDLEILPHSEAMSLENIMASFPRLQYLEIGKG